MICVDSASAAVVSAPQVCERRVCGRSRASARAASRVSLVRVGEATDRLWQWPLRRRGACSAPRRVLRGCEDAGLRPSAVRGASLCSGCTPCLKMRIPPSQDDPVSRRQSYHLEMAPVLRLGGFTSQDDPILRRHSYTSRDDPISRRHSSVSR